MADADNLLQRQNKALKNNSKRMSTLLFWQGRKGGSPGGRNWIHQPEQLVKAHVAYLVKFLGSTPVDQPKGIEVVKDAIKKLNFNQQLKAKENAKCKKVEITISVDGVAIQEPRSSTVLHKFLLHQISYCADDKGAKKYFSFIAKVPGEAATNGLSNGNGHTDKPDQHECFVFVSTKLAAEITLTIGQAFDLAYRRFLSDNGKYIEMQKLTLQNKKLELQVNAYKSRLLDLSRLTYKDDLQGYLTRSSLADVTEFRAPRDLTAQLAALGDARAPSLNGDTSDLGLDLSTNSSDPNNSNDYNLLLDTAPQRRDSNNILGAMSELTVQSKNPVVGTKLEGLLLDSGSDSDFDPRASEWEPPTSRALPPARAPAPTSAAASPPLANGFGDSPHAPPLLAPPPKTSKRHTPSQPQTPPQNQNGGSDLFGSTPFSLPSPPPPQHNLQSVQHAFNINTNAPNYDISDFNIGNSVFNTTNTSFTNGLAGYDPFETQRFGNGNGYPGNIFGNNGNAINGFERQAVPLDSSFCGFLDKRVNEMKDGFSRGITFGNDDFSIDNLDPLKKH